MEEKNTKKKNIIIGIITLLIAGIIVGVTYAFFIAEDKSSEQVVTTADIRIVYTDGTLINATDMTPVEEEEILTNALKKDIGISTVSSKDAYAKIDLIDIVVSDNLKDYDFKWALYQDTNKVKTGTFAVAQDGTTSINIATNELINSSNVKNYQLYIWIQETGEDQTDMMNGSITGKIKVSSSSKKFDTLASTLLSKPSINVFKDDNTKSNYGFPTYYNLTNTYIKLGTYKADITNKGYDEDGSNYNEYVVANSGDDIIWQVVRINEDGSVRLAAQHPIDLNSTGGVVSWYNTHIAVDNEIDSKIQVGNFCYDSTAYYRLGIMEYDESNYPIYPNIIYSFVCPEGEILKNSKVGVITSDEVLLSNIGDKMDFKTAENFDYDYTYSTIATNNLNRFDVNIDTNNQQTLPVINLRPNVTITGGSGTYADPYTVE